MKTEIAALAAAAAVGVMAGAVLAAGGPAQARDGAAPPASPRGKVIVAHTPESPRNGEGSFLLLNDGQLIYVYGSFTGMGDTARSRIAVIRSRDGGGTWSAPEILLEDSKVSLLHPSLVRLPGGGVGLAHSKLWSAGRAVKVFRHSSDEARTWSDETPVSDGSFGYMTGAHDRLIRVGQTRVLNTVHAKIEIDGPRRRLGTFVFASDDGGLTWQKKTPHPLTCSDNPAGLAESGYLETSIVETDGGELLMFGRTTTGCAWESRSRDAGETWSEPVPSSLPNPVAPVRLTRVPGAKTIVALHNAGVDLASGWHGGARLVLAAQVSDDGGRTWGRCREIEHSTDGTWYDYPAACWVGDTLHVAYRSISRAKGNEFIDVRYVRLAKAWLMGADP